MWEEKTLETINPCGFCGERLSVSLFSTYTIEGIRYQYNRCQHCRAVFLATRPSTETLAATYSDDYYGQGESKFSGIVEFMIDRYRVRRAKLVSRYLPQGGRCLDIGCGNGRFLAHLSIRGFEICGVELPGKAAERAAHVHGIRLKVGPLQPDDFPSNSFDAITLWHVFEHLTNPVQTLEIIYRIIKPQGFLFLSIPNIESLQAMLFRGHWFHLDTPRHLFLFGPWELIDVIERYSFRCVRRSFYSLEQNPFGILQSLLNILFSQRDILFEGLKGKRTRKSLSYAIRISIQKLFFLLSFPLFAILATIEAAMGKGGTMELVFQSTKR